MTTQLHLPGFAPAPLPVASVDKLHLAGLPLPELFTYPNTSGAMRSRNAKALGRAGESLLDSLLFRLGFESFVAGEHLGFDRILAIDIPYRPPLILARIQIKTTTAPNKGRYEFKMNCGYRGSPHGRRAYQPQAFDLAALVILPRNAIFFTHEMRPHHEVAEAQVAELLKRPQDSLIRALARLQADRKSSLDAKCLDQIQEQVPPYDLGPECDAA